jgi:hypothetical protein
MLSEVILIIKRSKVAFPKILIHEKLKTMIQFFEKKTSMFSFLQLWEYFFSLLGGICPSYILGLVWYRFRSTLKNRAAQILVMVCQHFCHSWFQDSGLLNVSYYKFDVDDTTGELEANRPVPFRYFFLLFADRQSR